MINPSAALAHLDLSHLDLATAMAGMAVCFFAGILGGMSGYGAGLLVTLFIAPIIGPKALMPVISVLMLINNASRVWFYRHEVDRRTVMRVAGAAIPMAWIGAELYVRMDSALVQSMLGAVLVGSVPLRRIVAGKKLTPGPISIYGIGATYGFLSSLIVGAGMLVVPLLMGIGFAGPALLGTDAAIEVIVNLAKTVIFGSLDALSLAYFLLAVMMGLCTVPGTWVAAFVVRRTSLRLHSLMIEGLILLGGAGMLLHLF